MFDTLKDDCLKASDFELHFAALVVFNELTTRRIGGSLSFDPSGNAVVLSPILKKSVARTKTPKKIVGGGITKQEAANEMFLVGRSDALEIGEDVELDGVINVPTAPPLDSQDSYHSVSPDPASDPRPIPPKKGGAKAKSRDP